MWLAPFAPLMSMTVSSSSDRSSCIRTERKGERKVPRLFRPLSPLSPMRCLLFLASPTAISHFTVRLPYCSTELDVKSSPHKCCTALGCPVQLWNELRLCGYKRNITPPKAFNGLITIKIAVCKGTEGTG